MASTLENTNLLLTGFTVIFFSGLFLANPILISASFIPLFIYFMKTFIVPPQVKIEKTGLPNFANLGQIVEVKIGGKVSGGPGTVVVWDEIPEQFKLVAGSNLKVVSKELKEKPFSFSYKIQCTKCGRYRLGLGWQAKHVLGPVQTRILIDETRELKVSPYIPRIAKMKLPKPTTHRINPSEGFAKIGPSSTDFKEIRNYSYGDPYKIINWKASAKAAGRGKLLPLVNEYEREGKLSIWLFLDANPDLKIGTTVENALEHGIMAAYGASHYFLGKGYNLGMYIYNHQGETLRFDTGRRQFIKIANNLLNLTPAKEGLQVYWDEGFSKAVERNQKNLTTKSPAIIIITHVSPSNWSDLLSGLKKILVYKRSRTQANTSLINILPYDIVPKSSDYEEYASKMLEAASKSFSNHLRTLGLTVLDWNPRKERMETALLNTVRLR